MLVPREITHWSLDKFIPNPWDIARHNEEEIFLFSQDLKANGQLHAVSATEDGHLISGHLRLLGARLAGFKSLLTNVFPVSTSATHVKLIRLSENVHRTDYTPYQKWVLFKELIELNSWQQKDLSENLHLSAPDVSRYLSPSKCIPEWQEALRLGQVGIGDVQVASKHPLENQAALLAFKLSTHATRDQLDAVGKTKPDGVKVSKVCCPLATGAKITVSGEGLSLQNFIEALTQALENAKKAQRENLDIKTAAKVWADKSRKQG